MKTQLDWSAEQWASYYDALSRKNYMAYQETGDGRYDRAYIRYEKIADAFRAKAQQDGEHEIDMKKRMTNCKGVIERLTSSKMYSKAEVEKLLNDAVWW